jgi:homoserine kinase type II
VAVYTDVSDEDLEAFLADYDLGPALSLRGVAEGVQNSNFLLHTQKGYFFLTLYEQGTDEKGLPFFLGLLEHLAARGVACPQPIRNRNGVALGRCAGRAAAIVSFVDGIWPRKPNVGHCAALGEAMAGLHRAGADFPLRRANTLAMADWAPLFASVADRVDDLRPGLRAFVEEELAYLKSHWPADLPCGVIHADLFPDNVLFVGQKISGLIDFYFSCDDFLAYDLAISLNAWCFEADHSFNFTKSAAMLGAYRAARPLSAREIEALPTLLRGASMRFLLTRLFDWLNVPEGALVKPKNPFDYYRILRFHQRVTAVADYGLV